MKKVQDKSCLSPFSKGRIRSDRKDKLPSNSQSIRKDTQRLKKTLYCFKGEKAKATNTRFQPKAYDGFSRGGKRCTEYCEGYIIKVPQRYLSFIFWLECWFVSADLLVMK